MYLSNFYPAFCSKSIYIPGLPPIYAVLRRYACQIRLDSGMITMLPRSFKNPRLKHDLVRNNSVVGVSNIQFWQGLIIVNHFVVSAVMKRDF